jgi:hypothetical protein
LTVIFDEKLLLQSFKDFEQFTTVLEKAFDESPSSEYAPLGLCSSIRSICSRTRMDRCFWCSMISQVAHDGVLAEMMTS